MYEPERPIEPPEAQVLMICDVCGCDICEGDEYFRIPEDELHDIFCEDCARAWLDERRKRAEIE